MKRFALVQHFNWRILLLRVLANAVALLITAAILPKVYFVDRHLLTLLWMALVLGALNALVKPVVQFLILPFIFATYGVVIVLINAGLLWFLSFLFPSLLAVDGVLWALLGGLVMGLLGSFLETLLGVTPPIVPEKYGSLRQQIVGQPRPLQSILVQAASAGETSGVLAATGELAVPVEPAPAPSVPAGAPPVPEYPSAGIETSADPNPSEELVPAATVREDMTSREAGSGAAQKAPLLDSGDSEE